MGTFNFLKSPWVVVQLDATGTAKTSRTQSLGSTEVFQTQSCESTSLVTNSQMLSSSLSASTSSRTSLNRSRQSPSRLLVFAATSTFPVPSAKKTSTAESESTHTTCSVSTRCFRAPVL